MYFYCGSGEGWEVCKTQTPQGLALFLKLFLICPVCKARNDQNSSAFVVGGQQPLEEVAKNLINEIISASVDCRRCGTISSLVPKDERDKFATMIINCRPGILPVDGNVKVPKIIGACIN
jgi:ribosomal protein L40E